MFNLHKRLLFVSMALLSSACTTPQSHFSTYKCDDLSQISVQWSDETARLQIDKTDYADLPHARAASGARYANTDHEIWEHHGELQWTDKNGKVRLCKPVSQ